jgi:hypothetical protein
MPAKPEKKADTFPVGICFYNLVLLLASKVRQFYSLRWVAGTIGLIVSS